MGGFVDSIFFITVFFLFLKWLKQCIISKIKTTMNLHKILSGFSPISLSEMSDIRLMNRTDTKYVVPMHLLPILLDMAREEYYAQEVNGDRNPEYHTIYLDTPEKEMFVIHQNGKQVREKIRVRTYVASDITFLEVKNKNNKGRTNKKRIQIGTFDSLVEDGGEEFLHAHAWYEWKELSKHLENRFRRITLVNKKKTERLTIDTNIQFYNFCTELDANLHEVVIIELKRDGHTVSPMFRILRDLRIRPVSISKYCTGAVLTNPNLKYNRFKPKIRQVERIKQFIYGRF